MRSLSCLFTFLILLSSLFADSQTNYALQFNGSNQSVSIAGQNSIDLSASFTLEAFIYPTGTGSEPTQGGIILNKENTYEIARFADGSIQFALSATGSGAWSWVNTGIITPLNTWSHIALVKSGTNVYTYLNGTLSFTYTSAPATMTGNTNNLWIAGRSSVSQFFNGKIDKLCIWNTALTPTDIKYNMFRSPAVAAPGLVALYLFNDGSGSTLANSGTSYPGLNGTLQNTPVWTNSPVQFASNSLSFDGTNDVATTAYNSSLDITSAITLEAWVYATKNTGIQNVICKSSNTANTGYIFPRTDDGWSHVIFYLHIGGAWRTITAVYSSLNTWHHLAATYDGATMKIYIDGSLAASQAQTGAITTNTNPLALGNQTGFANEYFGGSADEFRIWNVARTQAQIQQDMNRELNPSLQTGLLSYYTADQGIASGTNTGMLTLVDQKGNNNAALSGFTLSGGASNFVAQHTILITLPLQWLDFKVEKQNNAVLLTWKTGAEVSTRHFSIQRSGEGGNWVTIGQVPAAGNSNDVRTYTFTDPAPRNGINYYRIIATDLDGKQSFSSVRSLLFRLAPSLFIIQNNPVTDGVLKLSIAIPTTITLYNAAGQSLYRQFLSSGQQAINLSNFAKGVYRIVTEGGDVKTILVY